MISLPSTFYCSLTLHSKWTSINVPSDLWSATKSPRTNASNIYCLTIFLSFQTPFAVLSSMLSPSIYLLSSSLLTGCSFIAFRQAHPFWRIPPMISDQLKITGKHLFSPLPLKNLDHTSSHIFIFIYLNSFLYFYRSYFKTLLFHRWFTLKSTLSSPRSSCSIWQIHLLDHPNVSNLNRN